MNDTVEEEDNEPEPLSEEAAKLYLSVLMQQATKLRSEGALAADAVHKAECRLRLQFPQVPKLSSKIKSKIGVSLLKIKPVVDLKAAAILAANPDREARSMTSLGDLLRDVVNKDR